MHCSSCETQSPAGAKFCKECGAPLAASCPGCGAAVAASQEFCAGCGARLASDAVSGFASPQGYSPPHLAERILKERAALEGERKQETVLFADVSGFTRLSERLDPEEAHGLMSRAFELMMAELIEAHFELRPLGTVTVKNRIEPVVAWSLERARSEATSRPLSPLLGRAEALCALERAAETARTGRGRAVYVVGEPGIGKSRLLLELRQRLGDSVTWVVTSSAGSAKGSKPC